MFAFARPIHCLWSHQRQEGILIFPQNRNLHPIATTLHSMKNDRQSSTPNIHIYIPGDQLFRRKTPTMRRLATIRTAHPVNPHQSDMRPRSFQVDYHRHPSQVSHRDSDPHFLAGGVRSCTITPALRILQTRRLRTPDPDIMKRLCDLK